MGAVLGEFVIIFFFFGAPKIILYFNCTVPDMRVQGQLTCLEAEQKNKKKCCDLYVYMYSIYMSCRAPMMFTVYLMKV